MKRFYFVALLVIAAILCIPVVSGFQEVIPPTSGGIASSAIVPASQSELSGRTSVQAAEYSGVQAYQPVKNRTAGETYKYVRKWGKFGTKEGQFIYPWGVAVDGAGNIYVTDTENDRVQKFNSAGVFQKTWGTKGSDLGQFNSPMGIAVDKAGNVYVADRYNGRIQKFNSKGKILTYWYVIEPSTKINLDPQGIAVGSDGNVYVTETYHDCVLKYTSTGRFLKKWGERGTGNTQFNNPDGIAVDRNGYVYVADTDNYRIQKFTSSGGYVTQWGTKGSGNKQFGWACGVAADKAGNIYVADSDFSSGPDKRNIDRIQKFSSSGTFLTKWGLTGTANGQLIWPRGIAVDASGKVYVVEFGNNRVQVFAKVSTPRPTIQSVTPGSGYNSRSLTVTITGTNFRSGAKVNITRNTVTKAGTIISRSPTQIKSSLPLKGLASGYWNLTVRNTDGTAVTKSNAIRVISATGTGQRETGLVQASLYSGIVTSSQGTGITPVPGTGVSNILGKTIFSPASLPLVGQ